MWPPPSFPNFRWVQPGGRARAGDWTGGDTAEQTGPATYGAAEAGGSIQRAVMGSQ